MTSPNGPLQPDGDLTGTPRPSPFEKNETRQELPW
jgi:hypothetical protein